MVLKQKCILLIIAFCCAIGCTKPVDFSQASNLELEPVIESSLIFYRANAGDFFSGNTEERSVSDFVQAEIFRNNFVKENLIRADFVFEIENSINRAFELTISYKDVGGQVLDTFALNAEASPTNEILEFNFTEIFEGNRLDILKQTEIFEFTLTMQSGAPITGTSPGEIGLKSKVAFYFSIQ